MFLHSLAAFTLLCLSPFFLFLIPSFSTHHIFLNMEKNPSHLPFFNTFVESAFKLTRL